jgi:hypothetical protein
MPGHTCYHCKQWVEEGDAHDCWTTTESALTADLSDDLRDAWERLRDAALELGEQRIYASHSSIMFSRRACYFFVRPKRSFLEVVVFLGRAVTAPQIRKVEEVSRAKKAHIIRIQHRDQVEAPITDWIAEAYAFGDTRGTKGAAKAATKGTKKAKPASTRKANTGKTASRTTAAGKRNRVNRSSRAQKATRGGR